MPSGWFEACEVSRGRGQGLQAEFAVLWKCWVAERVGMSENTLSRTGAMGTRKLDADELAPSLGSDAEVVRPDEIS